VVAYTYDSRTSGVSIGAFSQAGGSKNLEAEARAFTSTLSPHQQRLFYSARPPTERLQRIFGVEPPARTSLEVLRAGPVYVADALGIRGHNPDGRGCVLSAPSEGPYPLPPRLRGALDRLALHMAAAFRLRERCLRVGLADAEAVFSAKGRIDHLEGPAAHHRASLLDAVGKRLQGHQLRRERPEQALDLWRALFEGRWSIVDHVDTDGKRFILARRNEVALTKQLALDDRERVVLLYASWGHSNKLISYETGFPSSTVSALLRRGLRKLRLRSRSDLVGMFTST
jgi:DNA-binding CsgD family transcriptional regulator